MAQLHEYQRKAILAANGFKIPRGRIVGAEAEEVFAGVVHVHVVVHHHEVFGEHNLVHAQRPCIIL